MIIDHIKSFKVETSHYGLSESKRLYLPAELNVTKMHRLFLEKFSNTKCSLSSYRKAFLTKFNLSFGHPRKDTCSTCDEMCAKMKYLKAALAKDNNDDESLTELERLKSEHHRHLEEAEVFSKRKANIKNQSRAQNNVLAVCFDFWKNLPVPSITTGDVYYKRQFSVYTFNIHVLTTNKVFLYCYDESTAKKGADDVCSMWSDFINEHVSDEITELHLFCDGCPGQNKNWTVRKFCHYLVHHLQRFELVKITFPIRGHSYMECDRDMACVKQKSPAEVPSDWYEVFRKSRIRPCAYDVTEVPQNKFKGYTQFLKTLYRVTCPVQTRPLREVKFERDQPRFMMYRLGWHGVYSTAVVNKIQKKKNKVTNHLTPSYTEKLPISDAKYADLQVLKRFCSPESVEFFVNLDHNSSKADDNDE